MPMVPKAFTASRDRGSLPHSQTNFNKVMLGQHNNKQPMVLNVANLNQKTLRLKTNRIVTTRRGPNRGEQGTLRVPHISATVVDECRRVAQINSNLGRGAWAIAWVVVKLRLQPLVAIRSFHLVYLFVCHLCRSAKLHRRR